MNADQMIERIGNVVAAARPAQEYCFLWVDWWPMCMTKSEWSGWMQALGVIFTIGSGMWVMNRQQDVERRQLRNKAAALLNTFGGSLNAVAQKLPEDGTRSQWDIRMVRVLLESELQRSDEIPLQVLSTKEQQGVFAFRLSAFQILEALRIVEPVLDENVEKAVVTTAAYSYLQSVIVIGLKGLKHGQELLGVWIQE